MGLGAKDKGWKKGPWTHEEDKLLSEYVSLHGEGRWSHVAKFAGLNRSGKSCRLRWVNYLRPGLKKGQLSPQEEGIIFELHALLGNKWSTIAKYLPGRTDNEIKNYWRTHFKKKDKPSRRKLDKRRAHNVLKQIKLDSEGVKTISSSDHQPPETKTERTETPSNNNKNQMAANIIMQPTMEEQCVPNLMYDVFSSSWSDSNNAVGDEGLLVSLWDHFDELPQAQHADHVTEFGKLCGMQNHAPAADATIGGDSGKVLAIQNQAWFDEIFNNLGCGKYLFG